MTDLGELGEQIQGASYFLGQIAGIEHSAKYLRDESGKLFAKGDDEKARIYRWIATTLDEKARVKTEAYNSQYRQQSDGAFAKLDEIQKRIAGFLLDGAIESK